MSLSLRRTRGALACVLILHLSLLAADLGCGQHPTGAPGGAATPRTPDADQHAHHQGMPAAERADEEPAESCRTASPADCCEALASCQVEIAFADAAERVATFASGGAMNGSGVAPTAHAPSPDVPPPKA